MNNAADYIKSKLQGVTPDTAIILGSGLGDFADVYSITKIPYAEIPGFKVSNVVGHSGNLVLAKIEDKDVLLMQGRYHFYEGHPMQTVTFPIKVLNTLGIKNLIITNAAGGINKDFHEGALMLITDHINFMGTNPLIGKNDDSLGPRFPDMSEIYKKNLIKLAQNAAKDQNISLNTGIYAGMTGPSYETPAEIRMLKLLGADAVGMSTVPEAIVANYCGMNVLALSCITNCAAGISDKPLEHSEVVQTANRLKGDFTKLLTRVIKLI